MNYFYYTQNPYLRTPPRSFYSYTNQMLRPGVRNGLNFNSLINSAQKGINTINQIIPIYKQIKPIYTQAKTSLSGLKKYIKFPQNNNFRNQNLNDNVVYENKQTNQNYFNYQNQGPSSPYY